MKTFEKIDKPIFGTAVIVYLLIFAFIVFFPSAGELITKMMNFTLYNAGEIYILAYAFFFIVLLALAFGKFGRFRLGKEEDRPEYSFMSWIAMLVGAGIGCGLIFYGADAIHMSLFEGSYIAEKVVADIDSSMFFYLRELPFSKVTIPVAMALIITLIVTSFNSGTFMAGEYCMGQRGTHSFGIRAFWGVFVVFNTCLFISLGGLSTLKYTALVLAFPFLLILLVMVLNLWKDMKAMYREETAEKTQERQKNIPD